MKRLIAVILFPFLITSAAVFAQVDSAKYYFQKGIDEKQKGHRIESLKNFEKAFKYDTTDKALLNEMALAYMDVRKYYQARDAYKRLVNLGQATPANYKQLLQLSFNLKMYDEAILYAQALKKADPSEKVSYYLGKINYDRENYGDALKYLNEAAKDDPQNAEIPYMVGRSYADMLNYKQAIPYYQKAVELNSTKYDWIYELGLICYAQNNNKDALKYIKEAGDKGYPKDNGYFQNLGIAYIDAGNFNDGIVILTDLLKKRPSDFNLLDMVAEAYYDNRKYDDAMNYWDTLLGYDKTNASALYMIGMCYLKKGDKAKGQQLCDKAIEMDPTLAMYKQKKQMPGL
ncbi:MAG TPA: tetratricopeptide repeat protein [Chitinophagaceae bacterium]|nr:tetratricopeptide repeat protein [Chitinophagaceae bacterium]